MNKKIKKQWIKALKSGEYQQGILGLHYDNKFCCLGVLCDLAEKEDIVKSFKLEEKDYFVYGKDEDGDDEYEVLPVEVMKWAGIESRDGTYSANEQNLTELNDEGSSFEEIAEVIKKYF